MSRPPRTAYPELAESLATYGECCPRCGHPPGDYGEPESLDEKTNLENYTCPDCKLQYANVYLFSGVMVKDDSGNWTEYPCPEDFRAPEPEDSGFDRKPKEETNAAQA